MYLEKLEIQGFKSFAYKNKLIFSGLINEKKRGLSAIVGPNGSGKSNIADAIRWALGEQSLKTLRGKKSEDVIFSGSDKKNQLSLAEVSLYLNNDKSKKNAISQEKNIKKENDLDQLLANSNEIIITRRLYRSGESEYLLNHNRVRLVDIQMFLAKANFGQKTYSVIGQGLVENFLNSTATERKSFFDEATGVKQFQIKRDTALNKLESSYENLQQVDMLLGEIKPRLKSLTRQVQKLKRRSKIEKDLKSDQLNYYSFLWQNLNKKLNYHNNNLLEEEKNNLEEERKLEKIKQELDKIRRTNNFQRINEIQAQLKDFNFQKNQYLKKLTKFQAELELNLEIQGKFDISWLNNKEAELNIELENIQAEIEGINKNNIKNQIADLENELNSVQEKIKKIISDNEKISNFKKEKNNYLQKMSKLEAILEANLELKEQLDITWLKNKKQELPIELNKIEEEIKKTETNQLKNKKDFLLSDLKIIQEQLSNLNEKIKIINKNLEEKKDSKNSHHQEISQIINKFLKKLDLLKEEKELQKIKELISEAKEKFKKEIKVYINEIDDHELTKIKKIQEEIINLSEKRQKINKSLEEINLQLNTLNERHRLLLEKKAELIQEINEIKEKLEKTKSQFNTNQIENEKEIIKKQILILDKNIKDLNQDVYLEKLNQEKIIISTKIQDLQLKISTLNERQRLLEIKKRQLEHELTDIKNKINKNKIQPDSAQEELEKEEIDQKLIILNKEIKKLETELELLNDKKEKEKTAMFDYQKELQITQGKLNSSSKIINTSQIEATRLETKLEDLETNIIEDNLKISEIKYYACSETLDNPDYLYKTINNNKKQLELIGGIDPETEQEYEDTKKRYEFLDEQTNDLKKAIKSLEEVIRELDKNIKTRFDTEFKVIAEEFNKYFKILFDGGNAKIFKLTADNENYKKNKSQNEENAFNLNKTSNFNELQEKQLIGDKLKNIKFLKKHNAVDLAGIEIQASPPGKKIQTVTMLSGGERALTAIALICAIISANPSPFVVLDEADASLDEANSERFAQILDDLSNKTQFIVITHNRACMRKASILYGITMENDGASKLLSIKLDDFKK